jgi:hypothetical protein
MENKAKMKYFPRVKQTKDKTKANGILKQNSAANYEWTTDKSDNAQQLLAKHRVLCTILTGRTWLICTQNKANSVS